MFFDNCFYILKELRETNYLWLKVNKLIMVHYEIHKLYIFIPKSAILAREMHICTFAKLTELPNAKLKVDRYEICLSCRCICHLSMPKILYQYDKECGCNGQPKLLKCIWSCLTLPLA